MDKNKLIFCILGRSAVGKTTIVSRVCKDLNLKRVKSYTTRPMRPNENIDLSDHYFISDKEFDEINTDDIVAYTEINGNKYCTTKQILNESDIYVIDPNGLRYLKEKCGDDYKIISIYIRVSDSVSKRWAIQRGEDLNKYFERRRSEDEQFLAFERGTEWDFQVLNIDGINQAVEKAEKIIKRELLKHGINS